MRRKNAEEKRERQKKSPQTRIEFTQNLCIIYMEV